MVRERLNYRERDNDGCYIFVAERSGRNFRFDEEQGRNLY